MKRSLFVLTAASYQVLALALLLDSGARKKSKRPRRRKFGRFYESIWKSILQNEPDAQVRAQLEQLI